MIKHRFLVTFDVGKISLCGFLVTSDVSKCICVFFLLVTFDVSGEGLWSDSLRLYAHRPAKLGRDEGKLNRELVEDFTLE